MKTKKEKGFQQDTISTLTYSKSISNELHAEP